MGDTPQEKQSEYNRTYYKKKRGAISEARKKRYQTDPEYRERMKRTALMRKRKLAEERAKAKKNQPKPKHGLPKPTEFMIPVGNSNRKVKMYSVGQLARRLDRQTQTLRLWEAKGVIPEAMYRSEGNVRLYTEFQVRQLSKAYTKAVREYGSLATTRIASTSFPEDAKRIWRDFPLGIDPDE